METITNDSNENSSKNEDIARIRNSKQKFWNKKSSNRSVINKNK